MRIRWGRPDPAAYAALFDLPPAESALGVTFLGVTTMLFADGDSAVLTDGFLSRPSLLRVGLGKVAPDPARIDAALAQAGVGRLDAVVPLHTHYDHALDSSAVARRTGAVLAGSGSAAALGRGAGLDEDHILVVAAGETVSYGWFALTFVASRPLPAGPVPGVISAPVTPPVKAGAYRCGLPYAGATSTSPSGCWVRSPEPTA